MKKNDYVVEFTPKVKNNYPSLPPISYMPFRFCFCRSNPNEPPAREPSAVLLLKSRPPPPCQSSLFVTLPTSYQSPRASANRQWEQRSSHVGSFPSGLKQLLFCRVVALCWMVPCTTPHSGDDGLGETPQSMEWRNGIRFQRRKKKHTQSQVYCNRKWRSKLYSEVLINV